MFDGRVWKQGKVWLVEIPALDIMTQGRSRKNALFMIKDAIEMLVDEKGFEVKVITGDRENEFIIYANDVVPLISLLLKQQRAKRGLSLADMQERLHAKSRNAYAQYEQGRSVPSIQKLIEFLGAMGETLFLSCAKGKIKVGR